MNAWLSGVCLMLVGCGGSGGSGITLAEGPDAAIASTLDAGGELDWIVARPVHDRRTGGGTTIDPRTLIAVESADQATWLVAARVDAEAGLLLSNAMSSTLRTASPSQDDRLELTVNRPLPGSATYGQHVVEGGEWRWMGLTSTSGQPAYTMWLLDQDGNQLAVVDMDAATAINLHQHLSRTIRAAPARFAGATDTEPTP